jgi:cytoskeletal protein CcmA (bactofilin family)
MKFTRLIKDKGTSFAGVIPAGVSITGDLKVLEAQDALRIEGAVSGNISAADGIDASIYIAPKGTVIGNITSIKAVIVDGGLVEGNIVAYQVVLKGSAVVKGDITYKELSVEAGSTVIGQLKLTPAQAE